jgi:hypothetical protein
MKSLIITLFLTALSVSAQSVSLTRFTDANDKPESIGEYMQITELPKPEWRDGNGTSVARLHVHTVAAAAWRIGFGSLTLPPGSKMVLYGLDDNQQLKAVHGPYEGSGPLNVPMFDTQVIPGATIVIEITGSRMEQWPFEISTVEYIDNARLQVLVRDGLEVRARFEPSRPVIRDWETRTAWMGDRLVQFHVIDGMAVVEGDIVLGTLEQVSMAASSGKGQNKESHALVPGNGVSFWPGGVIPYTIAYSATGIMQGSQLDLNIKAAINYWNGKFPGILVPRASQADYVTFRFANLNGFCQSPAGRLGGQQFIDMPQSCSSSAIIHEIGHAVGLKHEHMRPDRDSFVTINWNNIRTDIPTATAQFQVPPAGTTAAVGAYDFASIMHYTLTAFGTNGAQTITPKVPLPAGVVPGTTTVLSAGDISAVTALYCQAPANWGMPATFEMDAEGGTGSFFFSGPKFCSWTIAPQYSWITITGAKSGFGGGQALFSVAPNTGRYPRSGSIKIGARSTIVKQETNTVFGKEL